MNTIDKKESHPRLNVISLSVALFWSVLIVALAGWNYRQSYSATIETARSMAHDSYIKDLIYRRWAAKQGGVYVPITPETPPNPYLADVPERDISTPSGRKLTLVNPAYMTRQVHELGEKDYGLRGHITSLKPIRPENAPDEWEKGALQGFERGQKEVSSLEPIGNETYFRLMRPLITEAGCLKCHASQGYKIGDIRGGISVSVPWTPFHEALRSQLLVIILAYGVIWTMGILGLYLARKRLQNYLSDRKQMEETLRESEETMRYIIKHDPNAIAVYDRDLHYIAASDRYIQDYNVKEAGIIGKHHYDVFPEMPQKWKDVHQRCLSGAIERNDDDCFERPDGSITYNRWECRPWYRADGKIGGMITYTEVTTERKRAEEENRSLQERLHRSEKMEALGQLAGGVAHDLNNVLGVAMGYSELLAGETPEGSSQKKCAEGILSSTQKAAAIIQDLLTLARRGVMITEVVDFNRVVANLLASPEFDRLKAFHPQVTIKTDFQKDPLHITGSFIHLEKTVLNLVSNAVEAIHGSGEVQIRTENRYLDKAVRGYDEIEEGEYAVLTVSDTGTGISSEDIKKMFEPFFTKKKMGRSGTGLGLSIVWGTVKDHNGYIDVQSIEGEGTTFTLFFPVTGEKMSADVEKITVEQYMGHGESVLVVDDVQDQRQMATKLLMGLGYQVNSVAGGEEAVEYLKGNKADILVLDMIMTPGIDGLETYRRILAINPQQKAILVSGFSETDRAREAQRLGASASVMKPYRKEKIGVAIRDALRKVT